MKRLLLLLALAASPAYAEQAPSASHPGAEPPAAHADRAASASPPGPSEPGAWKAIDLTALPTVDEVAAQLADRRVVFVGETHDAYEDHLTQLAILERLAARHPNLALGVEYFQQPFQAALDDFVAGRIDEETMLRRTEYFDRWRYDWRLYRPIFRFAREHHLPVVALNAPAELSHKVAEAGIKGLSDEERARLPQLDRSDAAYRERLKTIFHEHPQSEQKSFENFYEAQLLWDESMAQRAADFLAENPERPLLVLAGAGHIQNGDGIPQRLERRLPVTSAIVLCAGHLKLTPKLADFVVLPKPVDLPEPGRLGVLMEPKPGGIFVGGFDEKSPAEAAGVKKGDRLARIDGKEIHSVADVKLAMLDRKSGDTVDLTVARDQLFGGSGEESMKVTLR